MGTAGRPLFLPVLRVVCKLFVKPDFAGFVGHRAADSVRAEVPALRQLADCGRCDLDLGVFEAERGLAADAVLQLPAVAGLTLWN